MDIESKPHRADGAHIDRLPPSETASAHTEVGVDGAGKGDVQAPTGGDMGAAWLAEYDGHKPSLDDEANKKIAWRIDSHLLPIIFLIYFCQQLDKSSM